MPQSIHKRDFLDRSIAYWNPGKTKAWEEMGVDLVIDRREGYYLYDLDGKRLIDVHLNGGTYNLGHRNPEVIEAMRLATTRFDIGNHHFPAIARTALAENLCSLSPGKSLTYTLYASSGGEAIDLAIKTARATMKKKKIVSVVNAYHGHTGLAVNTGASRFIDPFMDDREGEDFTQVPFNDIDAMEEALRCGSAAAVIMETIPATYGFPMPQLGPQLGYLAEVKKLCEKYDALYIADEVQTGLSRSGALWAIENYGVEPDILVTGKGISGGMYPIACVMVHERCGAWMKKDGFAHMATFGGSEVGCVVAMKVLEICTRPEVVSMVSYIASYMREELNSIKEKYADFFTEIRQHGVILGLGFNHPIGAKIVMKHLYQQGVWAIFSTLDPKILQFKLGILMDVELCQELIWRLDTAIGNAADEAPSVSPRKK